MLNLDLLISIFYNLHNHIRAWKKKSKPYERFRELMVGENQCGMVVEWALEHLD
ncbi:hypothetical protein FIU87_02750 [Bacillus sp. THAF10]|nr:hypothetical protein FIU87_02750 [Bacillus sp. THAF10]